ncbi:MAG: hypothetical protein M1308_23435, partial [Actinobacteria bacterium]|nr:hypothetical protein [Actinomycetota bacterium]
MHIKNKQEFKKFISAPLLKIIKDDFLSRKDDSEKIYRYELEIEDIPDNYDPVDWLLEQENPIKIYWSGRDKSFCVAGIGCADLFSDNFNKNLNPEHSVKDIFVLMGTRILNADKPLKYFGCLSFDMDDRIDSMWESFGKSYFMIPKIEVYKSQKKYYIAANILYDPQNGRSRKELYGEIRDFIETIKAGTSLSEEKNFKYLSRQDIPDKDRWGKNVNQAISIFDFERIDKIVLSRKSIFKLKEKINSLLFFSLLKKINIETYDFYFQNKTGNAFIGI